MAHQEAQTRHDDAVRALQVAQEKVQRLGPLTPLADLQPQKTAVETTHRSLQQLEHAQQVQAAEWRTRLAQHQREVVVLDGDLAVATARLARLAYALEDTKLRASSAGRLGAVAALLPGTVVQAGTWLGVLGPQGAFLVTADIPLQWRAGACGRASPPGSVSQARPRGRRGPCPRPSRRWLRPARTRASGWCSGWPRRRWCSSRSSRLRSGLLWSR